MASLFDALGYVDTPVAESTWVPPEPPDLSAFHEIELNIEATGLRWWEEDRPLAIAVRTPAGAYYLPFRHRGGNLDEATVKRWAQRELRGKHIRNINTRFDVHMARVWGVDLEAQGCTVSDVGHYVALLDDHRHRFNLDQIVTDYFGEAPMARLDESRMSEYHAGIAAPRALYNVEAVARIKNLLWPKLDAEDLQRVRAVEDAVIFVVCEMEKNGAPIDLDLLDQFIKQSGVKLDGYLRELAFELGWQCNPDSPKDMERAFKQLKIPMERTATGRASFTDLVLKAIDHPTVHLIRKATKLASLRSKFLVNTKKVIGRDGILRYALHQLRSAKDEFADAGDAGTVTGRFSSTEIVRGVGVNIQQRMKAARQRVSFGYDEKDSSHDDEIFLLRKLHIARYGQVISSDMDQAQYRIFASYANNPKVIEAYRQNPDTSFHEYMWDALRPYCDLTYRQQKDLDFAYLFGAGLTKMGLMVGHITAAEFDEIRSAKNYNHPKLAKTKEIKRIFKREVPEMQALLDEASHLAKPHCDDRCKRGDALHSRLAHRGYVRTVLGRRSRFPNGERLHKAFNSVDQGTEADVMKQKLIELHAVRKETGFLLRITNHDEVVGDGDIEAARKIDKLLNKQSFPQLRVPLTWSTGIGPNWADQEDI